MSPTKQEEYDASKEPFDPKAVYTAIADADTFQNEWQRHLAALKKVAYEAARALETEREKTKKLEARLMLLHDRLDERGLLVR